MKSPIKKLPLVGPSFDFNDANGVCLNALRAIFLEFLGTDKYVLAWISVDLPWVFTGHDRWWISVAQR